MSLENAVRAAFKALLAERLRRSAAQPEPLQLILTKGQREELARRVTAQVKALGEQEALP